MELSQAYKNQLKALAIGACSSDDEYRLRHTESLGVIGWPLQWTHADAAFVATAKPSVIIRLLEELDSLRIPKGENDETFNVKEEEVND